METVDRERREHQQLALKPLGISGRFPRIFVNQVLGAGGEAAMMAMPPDIEAERESQDADGNLLFMIDASKIDGADPLG